MARILVDANVLSEATKAEPNSAVVDWLRRNEPLLAVDPVILGEINAAPCPVPFPYLRSEDRAHRSR